MISHIFLFFISRAGLSDMHLNLTHLSYKHDKRKQFTHKPSLSVCLGVSKVVRLCVLTQFASCWWFIQGPQIKTTSKRFHSNYVKVFFSSSFLISPSCCFYLYLFFFSSLVEPENRAAPRANKAAPARATPPTTATVSATVSAVLTCKA